MSDDDLPPDQRILYHCNMLLGLVWDALEATPVKPSAEELAKRSQLARVADEIDTLVSIWLTPDDPSKK